MSQRLLSVWTRAAFEKADVVVVLFLAWIYIIFQIFQTWFSTSLACNFSKLMLGRFQRVKVVHLLVTTTAIYTFCAYDTVNRMFFPSILAAFVGDTKSVNARRCLHLCLGDPTDQTRSCTYSFYWIIYQFRDSKRLPDEQVGVAATA